MRPLKCFARPTLESKSPSRAYNPPTNAPILVPPIWSIGMPCSSRARSTPFSITGSVSQRMVAKIRVTLPTKCDIPRAPPPPNTTPIDLPQSLRASRAKSLECGGRCGAGPSIKARYLSRRVRTSLLSFLRASKAAGSGGPKAEASFGTTRPYDCSVLGASLTE